MSALRPSSSSWRASGGSAGAAALWAVRKAGPKIEVEANRETTKVQDIVLPVVGGEGSIADALWERLVVCRVGGVGHTMRRSPSR